MRAAHSTPQPDTLGLVVKSLFALAVEAAGTGLPSGSSAASIAGHRFEDAAAQTAYEALVRVGVAPYPPRHLLRLPTLSGLYQQFDIVVYKGSRYFVVELKRRTHSEIEQLYAFVTKLLDYALAARLHETGHTFTGVFVSTAARLNNNFRKFAITYSVVPVAPDLPPCQLIEDQAEDAAVRRDAADLAKRLDTALPNAAFPRPTRVQPALLLQE